MNDNETFEFENRTYINPDVSRDEQTAFIDTLRGLQDEKNAQIATETHNLGTDVEPHLGGLSGSEDYWKAKYQTPQTNAMIADMKAAAQQSALNNAMSNYSSMLQERYNQAYRDYNKRVYNHNRSREKAADNYYNNLNNTNNQNPSTTEGSIKKEYTTEIDTSGKITGIDAIQENMVRKETERIKAEEGLNDAAARAKALQNLGLAAKNQTITIGPTMVTSGNSSNEDWRKQAEESQSYVKNSDNSSSGSLPSWDSYGFKK